jgi:hypothetical protein
MIISSLANTITDARTTISFPEQLRHEPTRETAVAPAQDLRVDVGTSKIAPAYLLFRN